MLQVIAQDHQVMHFAARGFFGFPIQHLIEIILTGDAIHVGRAAVGTAWRW